MKCVRQVRAGAYWKIKAVGTSGIKIDFIQQPQRIIQWYMQAMELWSRTVEFSMRENKTYRLTRTYPNDVTQGSRSRAVLFYDTGICASRGNLTMWPAVPRLMAGAADAAPVTIDPA